MIELYSNVIVGVSLLERFVAFVLIAATGHYAQVTLLISRSGGGDRGASNAGYEELGCEENQE